MFAQSIMAINNKTKTIMKKLSISTKSLLWLIFAAVVLALTSSCSIEQCTETLCVERMCYAKLSSSNVSSSRVVVETVDLSGMTGDREIKSQGNNSLYQTTGDLNLNGYHLRLVNVQLTVVGNVNGNGTGGGSRVSTQGTSTVCVQGSIQNNPSYNDEDFNCGSLSSGGSLSYNEGEIEFECGKFIVGDTYRQDNNWYRIIQCY